METQIIQTDDPNVVIERTIVDKEIDLVSSQAEYDSIVSQLSLLEEKKLLLEGTVFPVGFEYMKDAELAGIYENIRVLNVRKDDLSLLLNYGS